MTNEEKYKTVEERIKAFLAKREMSSIATLIANEFAHWLALEAEAEEKPMPCPFCGSQCRLDTVCMNEDQSSKCVSCTNDKCMYQSPIGKDGSVAIAAHNRVCRAIRAYSV